MCDYVYSGMCFHAMMNITGDGHAATADATADDDTARVRKAKLLQHICTAHNVPD